MQCLQVYVTAVLRNLLSHPIKLLMALGGVTLIAAGAVWITTNIDHLLTFLTFRTFLIANMLVWGVVLLKALNHSIKARRAKPADIPVSEQVR